MTAIVTYDHDTQGLEPLAEISRVTALAVAPKYYEYNSAIKFGGWNLYAIEGKEATLLETYETEEEAVWVRDSITQNIKAQAEMIIV